MMTLGSEAWYVMVLYTLLALYGETGMPQTVETDAHMLHMAREQGKSAEDLRTYLQSGAPPAPQPPVTFGSEAWYVMVVNTVFALYSETRTPPTFDSGAHMLYMAREQGKSAEDLRAYLQGGAPTATLPPMTFASEAWYVMVLRTVFALYSETGIAQTVETTAHMLYMAREQGKGAEDLRAYLESGAPPAPQPTMTFASEAWYVMVLHTLRALYAEIGVPPTAETRAHMLYMAREQGKGAEDLREYLQSVKPPAPERPPARNGLLGLDNLTFVDGDGPYLAVGTSLFWALWGYQHDRARLEQHLDYLSKQGVDYIRVFGVIGPRWEDRVIDPRDRAWDGHLAGLLDLAHGTYGLRVELTIWQDTDLTPTPAERAALVDRIAAIVAPRPQTIQYFEICNEGYADTSRFPLDWRTEAQQLATKLRTITPHVVAVTSPAGVDRQEIASWYGNSTANLLTPHLPREVVGDGLIGEWRYVRQTWDPWLATSLAWTNDEGKGPQSSVAADDDPLRLTMYAALTWLCGGAGFVLHTGAGVGGGDIASLARGRVANVWETANIAATLAGINAMRKLLPADLPNWRRHNSNANFPGYPWETQPISYLIETNQLVRAFAATSADGRIVAMPIGVSVPVSFVPRFPMHIDVYDPMTGTLLESYDDAFTLSPRGAAVLIGYRR
jgi:hypothetical protein